MTSNHHVNPKKSESSGNDKAEAVADFCRRLISRLKFRLSVEAREQDSHIWIDLSGPDRSLLLINSAGLLNSLEYLVNKSFRTGKNGDIRSITLDSDDYRRHREAELVLLAKMASEKVVSQRKPLVLQPMTPKERRIVHLALARIEGVRSESSGEGENRSITIYLAE